MDDQQPWPVVPSRPCRDAVGRDSDAIAIARDGDAVGKGGAAARRGDLLPYPLKQAASSQQRRVVPRTVRSQHALEVSGKIGGVAEAEGTS